MHTVNSQRQTEAIRGFLSQYLPSQEIQEITCELEPYLDAKTMLDIGARPLAKKSEELRMEAVQTLRDIFPHTLQVTLLSRTQPLPTITLLGGRLLATEQGLPQDLLSLLPGLLYPFPCGPWPEHNALLKKITSAICRGPDRLRLRQALIQSTDYDVKDMLFGALEAYLACRAFGMETESKQALRLLRLYSQVHVLGNLRLEPTCWLALCA